MVVYYVVQITCVGQPFCLSSLYGITLYSVTILRTASESVANADKGNNTWQKKRRLNKKLSTLKELKIIGRLGNILHQAETNELV